MIPTHYAILIGLTIGFLVGLLLGFVAGAMERRSYGPKVYLCEGCPALSDDEEPATASEKQS